jgi:poly-gamma-glutamate synthesis protein (capsule biosynthesis protein)
MRWVLLAACSLVACDPYADWPDPKNVFPYVFTPETNLAPYHTIRAETETWEISDQEKAGLYLKKLLNQKPSAPTEVLEHYKIMRPQIPAPGSGVRLSFVGDVMWVGGNWKAFATPAGKLLDGDLRVGNLETPTSPDHPTDSLPLGSFNAPTDMLEALPLDLLQLNNNHSLDAGDKGLENTLREVSKRGYRHTGVDKQARVDVKGNEIALLAYTWGINNRKVSKSHQLHVIPFGHLEESIDLGLVERQVSDARQSGARNVVVLLHWGFEYEFYPEPHFMILARRMVSAGADLVVGHGPHVVQPAEICHVNRPEAVPGVGTCSVRSKTGDRERTAAILYSLGNFGTTMPTLQQKVGLVATVSLDESGVTGLGWSAAASVPLDGGQKGQEVVPLSDFAPGTVHAEELKRLERHLGSGWKR